MPGTRLPSSRALAADLGIARNTVADACGQLVAEGWLTAQAGSGTPPEYALTAARLAPRSSSVNRLDVLVIALVRVADFWPVFLGDVVPSVEEAVMVAPIA